MHFERTSPEACGISSESVIKFLKKLEYYGAATHGYIMARGDKIFSEGYYAPYTKESKQRMYSVSKSFTALGVLFAVEDGLLTLDDKIVDFFDCYEIDRSDKELCSATVRDHLTMRTSMTSEPDWWGKPDRAKCYFDRHSTKIPGTNYFYDSAGSFLLAVIVERLTGKPLLEYLKDKGLRELGFSEDSYSLLAPGGHSHADSGVMCTCRDLLIFARLMLSGGKWGTKQYLSEKLVREATSLHTENALEGITVPLLCNKGYGYLIWKTPRDGFAFIGMADQYAICDPMTDSIFIITSSNHKSSEGPSRFLIMDTLYEEIINKISDPLPSDKSSYDELLSLEASLTLKHNGKSVEPNALGRISGVKYKMNSNPMGISSFVLELGENCGTLVFDGVRGEERFDFGMGANKAGKFPGKTRMSRTASVYEDGQYDCVASAAFVEAEKLRITVRVTDTFVGDLCMTFAFKGDGVSLTVTRHAQRILDGYSGYALGYAQR